MTFSLSQRRASHRGLAVLPLLLATGPVLAHPGHGDVTGLAAGFAHPFTGLDHLVAMLALGIWAALQGGATRWRAPLLFAAALAAGAAAARGLPALPVQAIETAAASTLLVLAALLLRSGPRDAPLAVLPVALGAIHGLAHGAGLVEMSATEAGRWIAAATAATLLLHGAGLVIGTLLARHRGGPRVAALAIAGIGVALLASL